MNKSALKVVASLLLLFCMDAHCFLIACASNAAFQEEAEPIYQTGDFAQAVPLYEQLVAQTSDRMQRIKALRLLGDCYVKDSQIDKALPVFTDISRLIPDSDVDSRVLNLSDQEVCHTLNG